ncbi:MAG: sugar transferase [Bacillota bacterium]|nr:sugar transferase [Bacillota bacterium]
MDNNGIDKMEAVNNTESKILYRVVKRFLDLFGSIVGLIIVSPLILIVAIIIRIDSKGPIIFCHKRLGQGGKTIKVFKFRTMRNNAEELLKNLDEKQKKEFQTNFKLENDPRITRVGKFLRESSIDELPQLINVIKGEMTLVGPRPIVPNELPKYGKYADKLLSIRPGLTGHWQASGRSETTYEERVKLDMDYIDNRSLWMDFVILLKTFVVVFKKVGAK